MIKNLLIKVFIYYQKKTIIYLQKKKINSGILGEDIMIMMAIFMSNLVKKINSINFNERKYITYLDKKDKNVII